MLNRKLLDGNISYNDLWYLDIEKTPPVNGKHVLALESVMDLAFLVAAQRGEKICASS